MVYSAAHMAIIETDTNRSLALETSMQNLNLQMLIRAFGLVALLVFVTDANCLVAQTVQLPVFRTFGVRTAASVPDGGTINLGGVGRSRYGQSSQSGFGRSGGRNRFGGSSPTSSSLTAKVIRLREYERQMRADLAAGRSQPGPIQINGSHAVQAQADFISRNVDR